MLDTEQEIRDALPSWYEPRSEKERQDGDCELALMCTLGDWKLLWDPNDKTETRAAEEAFNNLRKKGYLAFKAAKNWKKEGTQIRKFDPKAERILMAPPLRGG